MSLHCSAPQFTSAEVEQNCSGVFDREVRQTVCSMSTDKQLMETTQEKTPTDKKKKEINVEMDFISDITRFVGFSLCELTNRRQLFIIE